MTETRAKALIEICNAILDAIKAAGQQGVPSGHLYAMLMGRMSLSTYTSIIGALQVAGKITNQGHVLRAVS